MKAAVICTVRGIVRYEAPDATCLSVRVGASYVITKQGDKSWWVAREIVNGLVSNNAGLIPSECVEVVGQGLLLPGLEPAHAVTKRSKKKGPVAKRSSSSSNVGPSKAAKEAAETASAGAAAAEVFAHALAEKDRQLEAMKKEVETMREKLTTAKKSNKKLRHRMEGMATCLRCGADVKSQKEVSGHTVLATAGGGEQEADESSGLDALVSQGYNRQVLLRFKSLLRSIIMRRRFRKVALDFKNHKASLVMRLRNESLREILTSEQKYVDSLQLAVDEFLQPMVRLTAARSAGRPVLTRTEVVDIFSTLEIIVELNKGLLVELKERLARWPSVQRFGDLFTRMAPILRLYSGYVRNFDVSQRVLLEKRETSSAFCEFLAEREKHAQGLHLESYLIMPVQRLPRYQMLLNGLLKYTDEHHVDYQDLQQAHARIIDICHDINFQRTVDENSKVLRALVDDVDGLIDVLGSGGSYFVHRGDLHSIMGASIDSFHYLLFSDVLVKAVPSKRRAATLSVVDATPISSIVAVNDIPDMEGIKHCMEVKVTLMKGEAFKLEKEHILGLCAMTAADKSTWVTKINNYLEKFSGSDDGKRLFQEATAKLKEEVARENESGSRRDLSMSSSSQVGSPNGSGTPTAKRGISRQSTLSRSTLFSPK